VWKGAADSRRLISHASKTINPQHIQVKVKSSIHVGESFYEITYDVYASGEVMVTFKLSPVNTQVKIPRVGLTTSLPEAFASVQWYGRGPHESYVDRKTSASVGLYQRPIDKLWFPYSKPQESGNRSDVRHFTLLDEQQKGFKVTGRPLVHFTVSPFSQEDLSTHTHYYKIVPLQHKILNIDYMQQGIAGDNSWGAQEMIQYSLPSDRTYTYAFMIQPIN